MWLLTWNWSGIVAQESVRIVDANGRGIPGVAVISPEGLGQVTDATGTVVWIEDPEQEGEWTLRCLGFVDRVLEKEALFGRSTIRLEEAVLDLPQALVEAVSLTGGSPWACRGR